MNLLDISLALAVRTGCGVAEQLLAPRLSVLIFHRVLPAADPLFPEEMHAARFDRLMHLVSRSFNVVTLGQGAALAAAGRLPPRALAITFDDGYADNAAVAAPILQRHGLVASFFVATGFLDGGRMWNDTIIETLRRTRATALDLQPLGLGLNTVPLASTGQRRAAIDALLKSIKHLGLQQRQHNIARLLQMAGEPALPDDLMMRSDQVRGLHRAGMEIGGHTVNHPILRVLPDAEAEQEILRGRAELQAVIGAPVEVFAYPNGKPGQDYDERHVAMVRKAGFKAAVSTTAGTVSRRSPQHELPRFTPWDAQPARWLARLVHQRYVARP